MSVLVVELFLRTMAFRRRAQCFQESRTFRKSFELISENHAVLWRISAPDLKPESGSVLTSVMQS